MLALHRVGLSAACLVLLASAGCRDRGGATPRTATTDAAVDPWAPAPSEPSELPVEAIADVAKFVATEARREEQRVETQAQALEASITKAKDLIVAGNYDDAEVELAAVRWVPLNHDHRDDELVAAYEQKREALLETLRRRRGGTVRPRTAGDPASPAAP